MILDLLQNSFNKDKFIEFIRLITKNFKHLDEHFEGVESENYTVFPVSSFKDNNDLNFQVILVETDKPSKIEKARIEQREIIRKYINENELGFDPDRPIREQEPNPLPDRKALDGIVFDALGLTEKERKEVYYAVTELVKNSLDKARSV